MPISRRHHTFAAGFFEELKATQFKRWNREAAGAEKGKFPGTQGPSSPELPGVVNLRRPCVPSSAVPSLSAGSGDVGRSDQSQATDPLPSSQPPSPPGPVPATLNRAPMPQTRGLEVRKNADPCPGSTTQPPNPPLLHTPPAQSPPKLIPGV